MPRLTPFSAKPIAARWLARCAALGALSALAGCGGPGASDSGSASIPAAAGSTATDAPAKLAIVLAHAEPGGPTTSGTITLAFTVRNCGQSPTPYHHQHGAYGYVPIVWRILRDDQLVGQGEILGLMPGDAETRRLTLVGEPPGDKTYRLVLDPDGLLALPDAIEPATIVVPYGSHG
jgi:hypothetical protein